jgi:hypothetical protein
MVVVASQHSVHRVAPQPHGLRDFFVNMR